MNFLTSLAVKFTFTQKRAFMKIAIISDIHGNNVALMEVLKDIKRRRIEEVIFLGDLVMVGTQPQEVFETIEEIKPIVWINGNTDLWLNEVCDGWNPSTGVETLCPNSL
jgi:predicted phosphodiesterase